jgi:hypothetical protein
VPKKENQESPRTLRPFRVATYAVYFVIISLFGLLVSISVVKSVRDMTPPRKEPSANPIPVQQCVARVGTLWRELEQARVDITAHDADAREADHRWVKFRKQWVQRFRDVEAECAVRTSEREELQPLFRRLETVLDLYTTHAVQYSGEIGGAVEGLRAELKSAAAK